MHGKLIKVKNDNKTEQEVLVMLNDIVQYLYRIYGEYKTTQQTIGIENIFRG